MRNANRTARSHHPQGWIRSPESGSLGTWSGSLGTWGAGVGVSIIGGTFGSISCKDTGDDAGTMRVPPVGLGLGLIYPP